MMICGTCGKENEDFFKFCLGCGADLAVAKRLDEGATVEAGGTLRPNTPSQRHGAQVTWSGALPLGG